jgi:G patch domain-containing protein 1
LGETPISTTPRSVFEYISQKDRERIQNLAAGLTDPQPPPPPPPPPTGPTEIRIPRTDAHIAQAALKGFQPFPSDSVKQERYNAYLLSQADASSTTATAIPDTLKLLPGQRTDEFNKELEDYAKAAAMFKPMTGAMAGRFTSAAVVEHGAQVREGLHTPSVGEQVEKHEAEERKRVEEKMTPQQNAAKLGMYGALTRDVKVWVPARLLCKRFAVREPEVKVEESAGGGGGGGVGGEAGVDVGAGAGAGNAAGAPSWQEQVGVADSPALVGGVKRDLNNVGLGEDESQGVDTLTYQRPSIDIFKAIFASDDEGGEEDNGGSGDDGGDESGEEEDTKGQTTESADITAKFFPEVKDQGPIDLNTFKPTFIPRDRKAKEKDKEDKGDVKEKKERKDKERKKKDKVLVSFEVEEEEGGGVVLTHTKTKKDKDKERPRKKRKNKERKEEDGNEDAKWGHQLVEPSTTTTVPAGAPGGTKGRKRAIDFM